MPSTTVGVKKESTGEADRVYIAPLVQNSNGEYQYENTDLREIHFHNNPEVFDLESGSTWAIKFFTFGLPGASIKVSVSNTSGKDGISATIPEGDQQTVGWLYFRVN